MGIAWENVAGWTFAAVSLTVAAAAAAAALAEDGGGKDDAEFTVDGGAEGAAVPFWPSADSDIVKLGDSFSISIQRMSSGLNSS